jgi:hypothetical protein
MRGKLGFNREFDNERQYVSVSGVRRKLGFNVDSFVMPRGADLPEIGFCLGRHHQYSSLLRSPRMILYEIRIVQCQEEKGGARARHDWRGM